jgi:hypothetical protein
VPAELDIDDMLSSRIGFLLKGSGPGSRP